MTPQLTPEQLRKIDAAVAVECFGYKWANPVVGLWLLYGPGDLLDHVPTFDKPKKAPHRNWCHYVPHFTTEYVRWGQVEQWMVEKFNGDNRIDYCLTLLELTGEVKNNMLTAFVIATAPLPYRCLAFLSAMGKDVEEILKEKASE